MKPSVLRLLPLLALVGAAAAHYNLKDPAPYNPIDCNMPSCRGPCPPIWKTGPSRARTSPENPAETWKRGQRVRVEWHRNNHEGGFYRRALVPVSRMHDPYWHKRLAFEWGCFAQGKYRCGFRKSCGSDMHGAAYRNAMTVPDVYPDGDYVFAMVWFGGLHWRRHRAFFSDYHTCAFVRIRGGSPVRKLFRPKFVAGRNHRPGMRPGVCASTSGWAGECGGKPCHSNRVQHAIPGVFSNGRHPRPVFSADVRHAIRSRGAPQPKRGKDVARRMREQEAKEGRMDRWLARKADAARRNPQPKRNVKHQRPKHQRPKHQPKPVARRQRKRTQRKTKKRGQSRLCGYNVPPPAAPREYWGPRYSGMFRYQQRRAAWRSFYCRRCSHRC